MNSRGTSLAINENRSGARSGFLTTTQGWALLMAPLFIAIPMAVFGVQHLIYLQFVAGFIPAWIPWRTFWAVTTGLALMASALGIVCRVWDRWAATLLGGMIFLWVLLLHTSRIAENPREFAEWRGIFQALAMSGCALVLARSVAARGVEASGTTPNSARRIEGLVMAGVRLGPCFVGVSMTALGVEHFIFSSVTTPQVPVWIPGTVVGNYLSGLALLAIGVGICVERSRRLASAALGVLILMSLVFVHLPVVLNSPRFESDWTKTLVLLGGAILLALKPGPR